MSDKYQKDRKTSKKAVIKAAIFALFIIIALSVVHFTSLEENLSAHTLDNLVDSAGAWAPIFFIFLYAAGVCVFLPGTLLTGLGAALFGAYYGFIYVWLGAMLGASAAFFIGRSLGRDFAASLIGDRLKRYDEAIGQNGFATTLYLRLVYFPFTPMNFGMGLTRVRFVDYFTGTGLGIIVGTFLFTFFIGTLKEVWISGDWSRLISLKAFFSLALFVFSFFIPKIVGRVNKTFKHVF